jgi:predicted ATP-binding protein involved in virulence
MANNIIKSFTINGLFGTTNLTIPFDDKVKILIGENGLGKTQVLNMLYFVLTKQWEKLKGLSFDNIVLETIEERIFIKKDYIKDFDREEYEGNFKKFSRDEKYKRIEKWGNNTLSNTLHKKVLKEIDKKINNLFSHLKPLYLPTL